MSELLDQEKRYSDSENDLNKRTNFDEYLANYKHTDIEYIYIFKSNEWYFIDIYKDIYNQVNLSEFLNKI